MSKRLKAVRQRRADLRSEELQLRQEASRLYEQARTDDRELTEAEATRDDAIKARLSAIGTENERIDDEIENLERVALLERTSGEVAETGRVEVLGDSQERDPMWGFRDAADFALAVRGAYTPGGRTDPRLATPFMRSVNAAPTNYHQELGSDEGRMVPPDMRQEVWRVAYESSLLERFMPEPTASNTVEILTDETTPWGSSGVQAAWRGEGTQMSADKLATNTVQVKLHQLYAFCLATDELLEDAPRLANRLTVMAGQAIRYKAADALVNGDGVGKPMGYLNAACLVSVAKESGQAADTVVAGNVAKMYARLLGGYQNAFWVANPDTLPSLLTMTLGDNSIFVPPQAGFRDAPGGMLLGRPVTLEEPAATVGDVGDITLVNPDGYAAFVKSGGTKFDASMHLYFDYGMTAFRWTFRMGGLPYLSAAVGPAKGSNNKSHFITVAART